MKTLAFLILAITVQAQAESLSDLQLGGKVFKEGAEITTTNWLKLGRVERDGKTSYLSFISHMDRKDEQCVVMAYTNRKELPESITIPAKAKLKATYAEDGEVRIFVDMGRADTTAMLFCMHGESEETTPAIIKRNLQQLIEIPASEVENESQDTQVESKIKKSSNGVG